MSTPELPLVYVIINEGHECLYATSSLTDVQMYLSLNDIPQCHTSEHEFIVRYVPQAHVLAAEREMDEWKATAEKALEDKRHAERKLTEALAQLAELYEN